MPTLRIATFNIRNINDRYEERRPLLLEAFAAIDPDIIGLQEVTFAEHDQDDMLAQALPARTYRSLRAESPKFRGFGNAILCAAGEVQTDLWRLVCAKPSRRGDSGCAPCAPSSIPIP